MLFIFDMGGVVTNTFEIECICQKLNLNKEDFFKICSIKRNIWNDFQIGKISSSEFWTEFNKRIVSLQRAILDDYVKFGDEIIESSRANFNQFCQAEYDLFKLYFLPVRRPKIINLIEDLKKNHRVVCGTNTIQSHWETHLECGDYLFFNKTYASNKIGIAKPNVDFFNVILESEHFNANQTFFVDDKIENCNAASSLGINTVHFTNEEDLIQQWEKYIQ